MSGSMADLGEFALIERLLARLPEGAGVLVGPGDDAAVVAAPGRALVAAADMSVEGHHFERDFSSPVDIGAKALAVNLSDLAAMAAEPRYALVSLGLPPDADPAVAEGIYEGIGGEAGPAGVAVVGGDTVASPVLIVSVAILGEAGLDGIVRRDGALPGDALCVTGSLGAAAAGLALLRARGSDPDARALADRHPDLLRAHRRPVARVAQGLEAAAAGAHAMIDISDGLAADVGHVCAASRVRAVIDGPALPVAAGVAEVEDWLAAGRMRPETSVLAARGGDDYELAIALPGEAVAGLAAAIAPIPLTRIGTFTDGEGVEVDGLADGAARGWDHFRSG